MATLKSSKQQADEAQVLASSFEYVRYRDVIYAPVDYETGADDVIPPVERKSWRPLRLEDLQEKAYHQFDTLFADQRDLTNFYFKVWQLSQRVPNENPSQLLVKTDGGLRVMNSDGSLTAPDGTFIPNTLLPKLNEDDTLREELRSTIIEWVGGSQSEATSLLNHLATALAPSWSAGKYVLLIGNGRNGKSLLMEMLMKVFGRDNCSSITRQDISEANTNIFDLTGKLLNVVMDGSETFLKDSGREKSLVMGETIGLRKLYQSTSTPVQTNALFIEGLNNEPRSKDKSSALQARLIRFWFPNKYPENHAFKKRMLSEPMLGAFLSLLLDHFVQEDEVATTLAPTQQALELQLEHMEANSLALQFILHVDEKDPLGADSLIGQTVDDLHTAFMSWRLQANDLTPWDSHAVLRMFRPVLNTERRSVRTSTGPRKKRFITEFTQETKDLLSLHKEEEDATTVVDD